MTSHDNCVACARILRFSAHARFYFARKYEHDGASISSRQPGNITEKLIRLTTFGSSLLTRIRSIARYFYRPTNYFLLPIKTKSYMCLLFCNLTFQSCNQCKKLQFTILKVKLIICTNVKRNKTFDSCGSFWHKFKLLKYYNIAIVNFIKF